MIIIIHETTNVTKKIIISIKNTFVITLPIAARVYLNVPGSKKSLQVGSKLSHKESGPKQMKKVGFGASNPKTKDNKKEPSIPNPE